jgi:tetratricopeptide (TPR) repeat protein
MKSNKQKKGLGFSEKKVTDPLKIKTLKPSFYIKPNPRYIWLAAVAIAVITFIVFLPSLQNEFVNWDDFVYVVNNPMVVTDHISLSDIFSKPVSSNYHPLTVLSLAFNYQLGKTDPMGYHLVNVLFHVFNTLLAFFFVYLLTRGNLLMAAVVSLFFGIHPMHVESVSWVSERKDVLYVFFFLSGLLTYLFYQESKKTVWYILTLLIFVLSCLSKGMAVVFPLVLLLIDYYRNIKLGKRMFAEKIPFFLVSFIFGITAFRIQQNGKSVMEVYSIFQRGMFACYGAVTYVAKFFIPEGLSAFYPYPLSDQMPILFYLSPIIIAAVVVLLWFFARKEKGILFGLLFYIVTVALVLQFFSVGSAILADRYSYLCYIGLLFAVADVFNSALQGKRAFAWLRFPLGVAILIGALVFSVQTYGRTQIWKNSETLWSDAIEKCPNAAPAYYLRGTIYSGKMETEKALQDYNAAIALGYQAPDLFNNRGQIYAGKGQFDLAYADFARAVSLYPDFAGGWINLAIYYSMNGKFDTALIDFDKAEKLDPKVPSLYINRAIAYMNLKDFANAEKDFAKALLIDPDNAGVYATRGTYYNSLNQFELALNDFNKAIQLHPDVNMYNLRGEVFQKLKRYEESIADFNKAIQLSPNTPVYWYNLSVSSNALRRKKEAKDDAVKAMLLGMKLDDDYLRSLN